MIISCKGKIGHESWQIANGRRCIAHSFIHNDTDGFVMQTDVWSSRSIGKMFEIDQPEILNVQLISKKKELENVIPFKRKATKNPMTAFLKHSPSDVKKFFTNNTPSVLDHEVEQGFVFTYNKLQGATLDRLILVLDDLTKCRLGEMSIHKLYVALSRVRNRKHLAILSLGENDLDYLLDKKYSDRLLAWDSNYDRKGKWRNNVRLVFEDVTKLYTKIYQKGGIDKANVTELREICRKLNIFYKNKNLKELKKELQESYNSFLSNKK